jgi:hypothetical protein
MNNQQYYTASSSPRNTNIIELEKTDEKGTNNCVIYRKFNQGEIEASLIKFVKESESPYSPLSSEIKLSYSGKNGNERSVDFKSKNNETATQGDLPEYLIDRHGNKFEITDQTKTKISQIRLERQEKAQNNFNSSDAEELIKLTKKLLELLKNTFEPSKTPSSPEIVGSEKINSQQQI